MAFMRRSDAERFLAEAEYHALATALLAKHRENALDQPFSIVAGKGFGRARDALDANAAQRRTVNFTKPARSGHRSRAGRLLTGASSGRSGVDPRRAGCLSLALPAGCLTPKTAQQLAESTSPLTCRLGSSYPSTATDQRAATRRLGGQRGLFGFLLLQCLHNVPRLVDDLVKKKISASSASRLMINNAACGVQLRRR